MSQPLAKKAPRAHSTSFLPKWLQTEKRDYRASSDPLLALQQANIPQNILSFIDKITNKKDLEEIYNLFILIDESTKSEYKENPSAEIFRKNLHKIMQKFVPDGTELGKEFTKTLIEVGSHDNEMFDKSRSLFLPQKSLNSSQTNLIKAHIKVKIPSEVKLRTSKETKDNFQKYIDENIEILFHDNEPLPSEAPNILNNILGNMHSLGFISEEDLKNLSLEPSRILNLIDTIKRKNKLIASTFMYMRMARIFKKIIHLCSVLKKNEDKKIENEIIYMNNFIEFNNLSSKHAAEYNIIKLKIYALMLKEIQNIEIKTQPQTLKDKAAFEIAQGSDFEVHIHPRENKVKTPLGLQ
ncbi:MAG: hypothetical protein V4591_10350, partial [Bdellovibrionota bacterium]